MSASVLPRDPVTGQAGPASPAAKAGIATINYKAPANFYSGAYLVASCTGASSPDWQIQAGAGGLPLAFGAGQRVTIGPVLMDPGEQIVITVTGADPGALIVGQWLGFQADTAAELLVALSALAAPGKTEQPIVSSPQTLLGSMTVPNAGTNTAIYPVKAGTHAIGVLVDNNNGGLASLTVQGGQSGINYIALQAPAFVGSGGQLKGLFISPILSALDTTVKIVGTCSATGVPIGPTNVYTVGILDAEGVFIYDNVGEPAAFYLTDQLGDILGSAGFSNGLLNAGTGPGGAIVNGLPVTVTAPNVRLGVTVTAFTPANNTPVQILAQNLARRAVTMLMTGAGGTGYSIYPNLTASSGSTGNSFMRIPTGGYYELQRMPDLYGDILKAQSYDLTSSGLNVAEWT